MSGLFYTLKRWRLSIVFILKLIKILYLTIFAVQDRSAAFNQLLIVLNDTKKKTKKNPNRPNKFSAHEITHSSGKNRFVISCSSREDGCSLHVKVVAVWM